VELTMLIKRNFIFPLQ